MNYENAIVLIIAAARTDRGPAAIHDGAVKQLTQYAWDLDQARGDIVRDLRVLAARFERVAEDCDGGLRFEVPARAARDVEECAIKYHMGARFLRTLVATHLGPEGVQAFEKAMAR